MTENAYFALMCVSVLGLLYGVILTFGGYRFFLFLLPIWGFFYGFGLGAQTVQALFGTGFLSDVTSWVVGFFVALAFASLSYMFYIFAVALIASSLGYALGAGLMLAILPSFTFTAWLVGMIVGVVFIVAVLALNIQKWVIIVATSTLGASVIVGVFLFMFGKLPPPELVANPVQAALDDSLLWTFLYLVVAALGIGAQLVSTRRWEIESYNRWEEMAAEAA